MAQKFNTESGLDPLLEDFLYMQHHGFWSTTYQGRMFRKCIRCTQKWWLLPSLAFPLGDMVGSIFHMPRGQTPFWIYLLCAIWTYTINKLRIEVIETLERDWAENPHSG